MVTETTKSLKNVKYDERFSFIETYNSLFNVLSILRSKTTRSVGLVQMIKSSTINTASRTSAQKEQGDHGVTMCTRSQVRVQLLPNGRTGGSLSNSV